MLLGHQILCQLPGNLVVKLKPSDLVSLAADTWSAVQVTNYSDESLTLTLVCLWTGDKKIGHTAAFRLNDLFQLDNKMFNGSFFALYLKTFLILALCDICVSISLCKDRPLSLIVIPYLTVLEVTKIKC